MESIREQIEYGTRCVHGIPLGTPGGADLMCGLCEDGLTTWVDDPLYELTLDITSPPQAPCSRTCTKAWAGVRPCCTMDRCGVTR